MNDIIRSLHARKSVRVFTDQPISDEQKREILMAAMAAPTAGNQQMYTILDITDPDRKKELSVTCDNQPFIATAPLVLIFCADFQKWYDAFVEAGCTPRRPGAGDMMLAVTDTAIAAQNAVVAAESMGIGSCYIGDIMENCERHREMLNLPEYVFPAVMLVFGYPTQQQIARPKPERCALEDIVCENTYVRKDGEALRRMFAGKHPQTTYDDWAQRFCNRKYNSDFSREMTRSVREYLKNFGVNGVQWCSDEDDSEAIITAERKTWEELVMNGALPETAMVFFMGKGLKHLIEREPDAWTERPMPRFLNGTPIYVHREKALCAVHGGYGAPMAADTVEALAALGVKRILAVGMCGAFGEGVGLGDVILPGRARIEEGASLHYHERIEYAEPDAALLERVHAAMPEAKILPIVTTDAVYRQTFNKEAQWREAGLFGVDMETSALFNVARKKGIAAAMMMIVSDKHPTSAVSGENWQWHMPTELREQFAERCFRVVTELCR